MFDEPPFIPPLSLTPPLNPPALASQPVTPNRLSQPLPGEPWSYPAYSIYPAQTFYPPAPYPSVPYTIPIYPPPYGPYGNPFMTPMPSYPMPFSTPAPPPFLTPGTPMSTPFPHPFATPGPPPFATPGPPPMSAPLPPTFAMPGPPYYATPGPPPMSTPLPATPGPPPQATPFQPTTIHNTPYVAQAAIQSYTPYTPHISQLYTPAPGAPISIHPTLMPNSAVKWDLVRPPPTFSSYSAYPSVNTNEAAFSSSSRLAVRSIKISSSSHPVLEYWIGIWGPLYLPLPAPTTMPTVKEVLAAVHGYLHEPLTPTEIDLLFATPQNKENAMEARRRRGREGVDLILGCPSSNEYPVLGTGYKRVDVLGTHRRFGGIELGTVEMVLGEGEDEEVKLEVDLTIGLVPIF